MLTCFFCGADMNGSAVRQRMPVVNRATGQWHCAYGSGCLSQFPVELSTGPVTKSLLVTQISSGAASVVNGTERVKQALRALCRLQGNLLSEELDEMLRRVLSEALSEVVRRASQPGEFVSFNVFGTLLAKKVEEMAIKLEAKPEPVRPSRYDLLGKDEDE